MSLWFTDEIDARVYTQLSLLNDAQNFYKNKNWEKAKAILFSYKNELFALCMGFI